MVNRRLDFMAFDVQWVFSRLYGIVVKMKYHLDFIEFISWHSIRNHFTSFYITFQYILRSGNFIMPRYKPVLVTYFLPSFSTFCTFLALEFKFCYSSYSLVWSKIISERSFVKNSRGNSVELENLVRVSSGIFSCSFSSWSTNSFRVVQFLPFFFHFNFVLGQASIFFLNFFGGFVISIAFFHAGCITLLWATFLCFTFNFRWIIKINLFFIFRIILRWIIKINIFLIFRIITCSLTFISIW